MASSALVGALRATLGLDTAAFEDGAKRAESRASKLKKTLTGLFAGVTVGAIATGLVVAAKSAINFSDEMGKMAQRVGVPVEKLSQLKYAADLADVSVESLATGFGILSKNMAKEGDFRPAIEKIAELADEFQRAPDGVAKTTVALKNFGRGGLAWIPLLNQGSAAIRATMKEADAFGVTVTNNTAKAAELFNDNLTRLHAALQGVTQQIAGPLLSALNPASQALVDFAKSSNIGTQAGNYFRDALKYVSAQLIILETRFSNVARTFAAVGSILKGPAIDLLNGVAWEKLKTATAQNTEAFRLMNIQIAETFNGKGGGLPPHEAANQLTGSLENLAVTTEKAKNVFGQFGDVISGADLLKEKIKPAVDSLSNAFTEFAVSSAKNFKSIADNFRAMISDLLEQAARALLNQAFAQLFGALIGGFGGNAFAPGVGAGGMGFAHFGGPRAGGGPVAPGVAHMVGERGREIFVPSERGNIIPTDQMGGATFNIINKFPAAQVSQQRGADGSPELVIEEAMARLLSNPRSRVNKVLAARGAGPPAKQR